MIRERQGQRKEGISPLGRGGGNDYQIDMGVASPCHGDISLSSRLLDARGGYSESVPPPPP